MMKKIYVLMIICLLLQACSSAKRISNKQYAPVAPTMQQKPQPNGSIYHASSNVYLFEDVKARRVGDTLTVILEEQTDASKTASTSASKTTKKKLNSPTILGGTVTKDGVEILNTDMNSSFNFEGGGDSSQSNSLTGNITVTVAQVLANGNLLVRGEKILTLNQGSEVVRVSGIVRPIDITPENTVQSGQIAGAEITYSSNGIVGDSNQSGWFSRIFNSGWWPF